MGATHTPTNRATRPHPPPPRKYIMGQNFFRGVGGFVEGMADDAAHDVIVVAESLRDGVRDVVHGDFGEAAVDVAIAGIHAAGAVAHHSHSRSFIARMSCFNPSLARRNTNTMTPPFCTGFTCEDHNAGGFLHSCLSMLVVVFLVVFCILAYPCL